MLALLDAFFRILTRRLGPEDLPDSQFLLSLVLGAYMAAQVPAAALIYGGAVAAFLAIVADTALLALCCWVLLTVTSLMPRFRRTLTALLGTGALLALPQAPLVYLSRAASAAGETPVGATVGLLALLLWSVVVQAHIVSRALSSGFVAGLAVALAYFLLSFAVSGQFGPVAG
ncbi:MAG: hypothetical protein IT486_01775 [Gammaproteobacteria bacterium]|nr:hypothetical protein [Gammaproteobacteria bacterium]